MSDRDPGVPPGATGGGPWSGGPAGPPVCPRHPEREAYVRCQRCGRPTCPECQREAPVGVQCVDCVAEARRQAPTVRTALGGTARGGRPVVTFGLIGACAAVYVLQLVTGGLVFQLFALAPWLVGTQPYRLLTSAFLHSQGSLLPFHLLLNMYVLYVTGPALEHVLGRGRFLALYLLSALGGSVAFTLVQGLLGSQGVAVGASGAVFGLFGALVVLRRRFPGGVRSIGVVLAINLAIGFVVPNIAWEAHLGGLAVGAGVAAVLSRTARQPRAQLVALAAVVVALALLAAVAAAVAA